MCDRSHLKHANADGCHLCGAKLDTSNSVPIRPRTDRPEMLMFVCERCFDGLSEDLLKGVMERYGLH
jgi:hypothetical protein